MIRYDTVLSRWGDKYDRNTVESQILYSISIEFSISPRTKFLPNRILKRQAKYRSWAQDLNRYLKKKIGKRNCFLIFHYHSRFFFRSTLRKYNFSAGIFWKSLIISFINAPKDFFTLFVGIDWVSLHKVHLLKSIIVDFSELLFL